MTTPTLLMTGEAVARYALEREIPFPFTTQAGMNGPDAPFSPPRTLAEMASCRRRMSPRQIRTTPMPHFGLGLTHYAQVTSPLRRYSDLVAHQQIRAHLRASAPLDAEDIIARIHAIQTPSAGIRKAERLSRTHWTLVYLSECANWRGEGVLLDKGERRGTFLIKALGLEIQARYRGDPMPDDVCPLTLREIDLPRLTAYFQVDFPIGKDSL